LKAKIAVFRSEMTNSGRRRAFTAPKSLEFTGFAASPASPLTGLRQPDGPRQSCNFSLNLVALGET
jgi:hypothetical protein